MTSFRFSLEEKLKFVCLHSGTRWSVDSITGRSVCYLCGKPSSLALLRKCVDCDDEFILNFGPEWLSKFYVTRDGKVIEREFYCTTCY